MISILNNNFIEITVDNLISNILSIRIKALESSKLYIVVKSNFYGLGIPLLKELIDYVDGVVVGDINDYLNIKTYLLKINKEIIILYPNLNDKEIIKEICSNENLYFTIMNIEDYKYVSKYECFRLYLRIDPFLGLHGVDFSTAKSYLDKYKFYGVLVHVNEYLDIEEENHLLEIINWAKTKNLKINIGGSAIVNYERILNEQIDLRFTKGIIAPINNRESILLKTRILMKSQIESTTQIGYKSDRIHLEKGTILLISLGYGDFKMLPIYYEQKTPLIIEGKKFYIPCYPCMNTCWLYCEEFVEVKSEYIDLYNSIISNQIINYLDLDQDEILSSFSENIERNYIKGG
ncbi:alanine racemase [Metasolibacillus meyeri]|uniref:Alanine racemase n=1 Tax=Metasolibacillus meyeri TaxID=1071052 RepID=A0AAW9NSF7_9BACL|nr:alanine racemase C-terminal domain-containing protein [Metasolibacillus meyeri]MEC1178649.1 alanine racemase [Metasolibacillus meyeri]